MCSVTYLIKNFVTWAYNSYQKFQNKESTIEDLNINEHGDIELDSDFENDKRYRTM